MSTRPTIEGDLTHLTAELEDGHSNPVPPSAPGLEPTSILEKVLQFIRTVYETVTDIFPSILRAIGAVWNSIVSTIKELYPGIRDQIFAWYLLAVQFVEDYPGIFVVILLMILSALFWHFSRQIVTAVMVIVFALIYLPFLLFKAGVIGVRELILRSRAWFPPL